MRTIIPILIVLSDMKQPEAFVSLDLLLPCNVFFEDFNFNSVLHFGRNEFRIKRVEGFTQLLFHSTVFIRKAVECILQSFDFSLVKVQYNFSGSHWRSPR